MLSSSVNTRPCKGVRMLGRSLALPNTRYSESKTALAARESYGGSPKPSTGCKRRDRAADIGTSASVAVTECLQAGLARVQPQGPNSKLIF